MFLCNVFNPVKNLIMKQKNEETKEVMRELSKEELENIVGGMWWEVRAVYGRIVFIFHPYDE